MNDNERHYVLEQALELVEELGLGGARASGDLPEVDRVVAVLREASARGSLPEAERKLLHAELALLEGRFSTSVAFLREVAESAESTADLRGIALDRLGDLSWFEGRLDDAAHAYQRSLALRPHDVRTRLDLARVNWVRGGAKPVVEPPAPVAVQAHPCTAVEAERGSVGGSKKTADVIEVAGLYVSEVGSGILVIQGRLDGTRSGYTATGSLGHVANEACDLAWSLWEGKGLGRGIRLHFAQAAVPKDGPSLGLAVYALIGGLLGALTIAPWDSFTGELDLKGRVLPVGGIVEKVKAAYLSNFRRVLLPAANFFAIPQNLRERIDIKPIEHVGQLEALL